MFRFVVSTFVSALVIMASVSDVNACQTSSPQNFNFPECQNLPPLNVEYYVDPNLFYIRSVEIGLTNPNMSAVPENFVLSAGAIAMTETLNQLFLSFQTIHHGSPSLFNVSVPVILNEPNGTQCLFWPTVSVIPQYNLTMLDVGAGISYVDEGVQGRQNNRDSCSVCSNTLGSNAFAMIHGTLDVAELYDVTAQICNSFNVPAIAASITDITFQELFPNAAITAEWSAVSALGPAQIGYALNNLMYPYQWYNLVLFADITDSNQITEVENIARSAVVGTVFAFMQGGTGCTSVIQSIVKSPVSIMYFDMDISKGKKCAADVLKSGLLQRNYVLIWGPTLMDSVNNNVSLLASEVGLPLSNFTGTFTLQLRKKEASFVPLLNSNINSLFASWGDPSLSQYQTAYASEIFDNANAAILASQGIYGLFSTELCLFSNQALNSSLPNNGSSFPDVVSFLTSNFISFISGSTNGTYSVTQSGPDSWKINVPMTSFNLDPSSTFTYYSQSSGMWSTATNFDQWYHDDQGNALVTIDIYNIQGDEAVYVGNSFNGYWYPNSSFVVEWPNPSALWQYNSGWPSDSPPLLSLALECAANFSCSSALTYTGIQYLGQRQVITYATEATLTGTGSWNMQVECAASGITPSYSASLTDLTMSNVGTNPWKLNFDAHTGEIQVNFDPSVINPDQWAGENVLVSFKCISQKGFLNGSLQITVNNDPSEYTPSSSYQWGLGAVNVAGIAFSVLGALFTLIFRHRRPIYASSVSFLVIAWIGFGLLFGSGLVSILSVSGDSICQTRSWLFNYGFVLVMGALFLKTYHIHTIFNNDKLMIRQISMWHFVMTLGIMLSLLTIVMLDWQLLDDTKLHRVSAFQPYCTTRSWVPFHIIAGLELALIMSCLWVSYRIRRVHQDYNESKCIAFVVYNTAFWGIAWWVLSSQESISPATLSLVTSFFICIVCFMNMFTFFFPKFYALSQEDIRTLSITPRNNSRFVGSKADSAIRLSAMTGSDGLTFNQADFVLPEDPKDALKQAREKLFETLKRWKGNDVEHKRLKNKVHDHEVLRDNDTHLVNNWMSVIRSLLTSRQLSSRDSDGFVGQMTNLVRMDVAQLMEEAERYEEIRKRNATQNAVFSSPKISSRPQTYGTSSAVELIRNHQDTTHEDLELTVNVNPHHPLATDAPLN